MEKLKQTLKSSISEKIFSAAAIEVNQDGKNILSLYEGSVFFDQKGSSQKLELVTPEHMFDLASLTKPLCTSLLASILIEKDQVSFNTRISEILEEYALSYNRGIGDITIGQLLNHSSGLDAWAQIYSAVKNRSEAYMFVRSRELAYRPGTKHVYSDLGYMLLGELIEVMFEHRLDYLFEHFITSPLELHDLSYVPIGSDLRDEKKFVSSGHSLARNRLLTGEVNDDNAFVFEGVAGHAGLFGTARDVCSLGQHLLDTINGDPEHQIMNKRTLTNILERPSDGSDWAYGWHYPSMQGSTGGKLISKNSVGMTGFTGTSLWIDIDNSVVITVLANRTAAPDASKFGGVQDRFSDLRPVIHDMIMGEIL